MLYKSLVCSFLQLTSIPWSGYNTFIYLFIYFWLFVFLGLHRWLMEVARRGINRSCCCQPMPKPQQRQIQAASANYTTAHGNAGSLTYWARPGIKPKTSWFLVRFVSAAPRRELPGCKTFYLSFHLLVFLNFGNY